MVSGRTLSQAVTEAILDRIRAGEYRPGDRLSTEKGLMEQFGVGRNVVREAVQGLVAMGLVDVRPGRGAVVIGVDTSRAMDPGTVAALLLDQTVDDRTEDASQQVTMEWSGQQPGASYTVRDGDETHDVQADDQGVVRYAFAPGEKHRVTLVDGDAAGFVLDTDVPENLAVGAPVTVSSSGLANDRFGTSFATDGARFSTDPSMGWSSDSQLSADHAEWISLDLGAAKTVGRVDLLPRNYDGRDIGKGFPSAFTIETSLDGVAWAPAVAQTGYVQPTTFDVPSFTFDAREARYVRVTGTSLRQTDGGYRMQLAEVEVFGPPA